jgi:hypothetical protein
VILNTIDIDLCINTNNTKLGTPQNMKPHHFILWAIALLPMSFSLVSAIDNTPAIANQQTDGQWKQYLGGRRIVQFSNYSSGYGGGGMSSQFELQFCKNGKFTYTSQSSVSMSAGDASGNSSGQDSVAGTWKIIESNPQVVLFEVTYSDGIKDSEGLKERYIIGFGADGKLYNNAGKKLLTEANNAC